MDVDKCNFYAFVARDRAEFARYSRAGHGAKTFRLKGVDILWKCKNETVVLVLSEVAKPNTPEEISMLCNYVAAAIIRAHDGEPNGKDIQKKLIERECVSVFVHWGGGRWEKHESTAQEALKNSAYTKWSVFAISSTRTNIGMEPGRIPDSEEALADIVHRCKDALSDKILMCLAAGSFPTETGDVEKIEERLKRLRDRMLLSSLKTDKKRKMIEEIQRTENAIKSKNLDELKRIVPFLAKILNKEVFNG